MFGMSHESYLLLDAVVTIIGLIVLITKFKVHPFIALIIAAGFLGLTSGMPVDKIIKAFQDGFGGVLGFVGIILALGTMLGKMMASATLNKVREGGKKILGDKNKPAAKFVRRWEEHWKGMFVPSTLFEEMGFHYNGPIDGHDLPALLGALKTAKTLKGPQLLHVLTTKGKGYIVVKLSNRHCSFFLGFPHVSNVYGYEFE